MVDRMPERREEEPERGLLPRLTNLIRSLNELAETGGEIRKEVKRGGIKIERKVSARYIVPSGETPRRLRARPRPEPTPKLEKVEAEPLEKEPLVDVFDQNDHILVVASIPGIADENLDLDITEDGLEISAKTESGEMKEKISIPEEARVEGVSDASFKRGTLEVLLKKKDSS